MKKKTVKAIKRNLAKAAINFLMIQTVIGATSLSLAFQIPIPHNGILPAFAVIFLVLGAVAWIPAAVFSLLFAYAFQRK